MARRYQENEVFKQIDFSEEAPPGEEFENCTFLNCNFSNIDLGGLKFSECLFESCDLSMAGLEGTALQDVTFKDCKLLGLRFDECHNFLLNFSFEECILNFSSFYKLNIPNTPFVACTLIEVEFIGADLSGSRFDACNLSGAVFENTKLEKTDFRSATHFSIDPALNQIKRAKFSIIGLSGLLDKYDISIEN